MERPKDDSGRVESRSPFDLSASATSTESAGDSLGTNKAIPNHRRRYLTQARVTALERAMNARQRLLLDTVRLLRLVSAAQLLRLHYSGSASDRRLARSDLAWMAESQLLCRLDRRIGGVRAGSSGYVYALGVAGERVSHPERSRHRSPRQPGQQFVAHTLAVSELYVGLRAAEGVVVELAQFEAEPTCWRSFAGPGGSRSVLKPDAYLLLVGAGSEYHWFAEVDCATENPARIRDKARVYVDYWQSGREQARRGVFPRTVFVVPDEHRRQVVVRALGELPAERWRLFAVAVAGDVAMQLTRPADAGHLMKGGEQ